MCINASVSLELKVLHRYNVYVMIVVASVSLQIDASLGASRICTLGRHRAIHHMFDSIYRTKRFRYVYHAGHRLANSL